MDMEDRRCSQETAYGCRQHYRFRHPDTRAWMQMTCLDVAHVEQVFRYCGLRWNVQWVACDQCEAARQAVRYAPRPTPDRPAPHAAA
jgi:hypothetical protein